jgi:hypothetical protein
MSYLLRIAFALLLAASINMPASGQSNKNASASRDNLSQATSAHSPGDEAANLLAANQQSAIWQLDQLFRLTKEFDDGFLKIKAQAQIADVLWKYDEPRARDMFKDAFREIESPELAKELSDGDAGKSAPKTLDFARLYSLKYKLRSEVILLISRRDSRLADALVKSLSLSAPDADTSPATINSAAVSDQTILYMQLAMRIAQTNPQGAARLVRLGINNGINPMLAPVLTQIRSKDPAIADQLFAYAIMVAQKETVSLTEAITWMAPYLFPDFERAPQAPSDERAQAQYVSAKSSQANLALRARYLEFAYALIIMHLDTMQARAVNNPSALAEVMSDYRIGQMMLPLFEQFAPESAAPLRTKLEWIANFTSSMGGGRSEENSNTSNSVQDLIEEAEAVQSIPQKDAFYARAAVMAARVDEVETAFSIIKKISDEPRRNSLETALRYRAALVAIGKGKLDLAYNYGKDISDLRQHALIISKITVEFYKRHKLDRAAELLDEATRFVMNGESGQEQLQAMLTLTDTATQYDPARGFELMALAVKAANSDASSQTQGEAKQTEKHLAGEQSLKSDVYVDLALNLDRSLTLLAQLDFSRSLLLAQSLRKKELSTFAQLTVCRAVLSLPRKS